MDTAAEAAAPTLTVERGLTAAEVAVGRQGPAGVEPRCHPGREHGLAAGSSADRLG